jgi:hypothetical protein
VNWGRSILFGAALAAAGTVAALTHTEYRPHARSEAREGVVMGPGGIPTIKAEPGPLKVKPKDPGGLKVPHREKSIYEQLEGGRKPVPAADSGKVPKKPEKKLAQAIGPYRVQLGSFETAATAQKRWQQIKSRHGDLVGKLEMVMERVQIKAKGTVYRLQAGPLKTPAEAQNLCAALAKRKVGCLQVKA